MAKRGPRAKRRSRRLGFGPWAEGAIFARAKEHAYGAACAGHLVRAAVTPERIGVLQGDGLARCRRSLDRALDVLSGARC